MNINLYFGHSIIQVNKIINNNNQASSLIPGKSYIVLLCKVSKKKKEFSRLTSIKELTFHFAT